MPVIKDILHATSVAVSGKAVLIVGPSGSGKSSLALQLLALGATLVADDRTVVKRQGKEVIASAPDTIKGKIEARGVGLLDVPATGTAPVALVVDMNEAETQRLPEQHCHDVLGLQVPCLHKPDTHIADTGHFPSAVLLYMKAVTAGSL